MQLKIVDDFEYNFDNFFFLGQGLCNYIKGFY